MSIVDTITQILNSKKPDYVMGEEQKAADVAAAVELRKQKIEAAAKLNQSLKTNPFAKLFNLGVK